MGRFRELFHQETSERAEVSQTDPSQPRGFGNCIGKFNNFLLSSSSEEIRNLFVIECCGFISILLSCPITLCFSHTFQNELWSPLFFFLICIEISIPLYRYRTQLFSNIFLSLFLMNPNWFSLSFYRLLYPLIPWSKIFIYFLFVFLSLSLSFLLVFVSLWKESSLWDEENFGPYPTVLLSPLHQLWVCLV